MQCQNLFVGEGVIDFEPILVNVRQCPKPSHHLRLQPWPPARPHQQYPTSQPHPKQTIPCPLQRRWRNRHSWHLQPRLRQWRSPTPHCWRLICNLPGQAFDTWEQAFTHVCHFYPHIKLKANITDMNTNCCHDTSTSTTPAPPSVTMLDHTQVHLTTIRNASTSTTSPSLSKPHV